MLHCGYCVNQSLTCVQWFMTHTLPQQFKFSLVWIVPMRAECMAISWDMQKDKRKNIINRTTWFASTTLALRTAQGTLEVMDTTCLYYIMAQWFYDLNWHAIMWWWWWGGLGDKKVNKKVNRGTRRYKMFLPLMNHWGPTRSAAVASSSQLNSERAKRLAWLAPECLM